MQKEMRSRQSIKNPLTKNRTFYLVSGFISIKILFPTSGLPIFSYFFLGIFICITVFGYVLITVCGWDRRMASRMGLICCLTSSSDMDLSIASNINCCCDTDSNSISSIRDKVMLIPLSDSCVILYLI